MAIPPLLFHRLRGLLLALLAGAIMTGAALALWNVYVRKPQQPTDSRTTLYLGWLYSGAYGGEALAAKRYARGERLEIFLQPGGPGLDPLRLVRDNTFGVASSDEVIRAIEKGLPVVIIAVLNDKSPAAFASLADRNIHGPKDFVGKRVGLLPFGSTGLIYQSLLARSGIARDRVTEVTISPDLRSFITGQHDVQPVYAYDEPVSLDAQGIRYNLLLPQDFGVNFKGPVYFTTVNTLRSNPELVESFLRAAYLGWGAAIESPADAISILAEFSPSINQSRELEVLKRAIPYYNPPGGRRLTSDSDSWRPMIQDMVRFGVLTRQLEPSAFLDLSIITRISR